MISSDKKPVCGHYIRGINTYSKTQKPKGDLYFSIYSTYETKKERIKMHGGKYTKDR